MRRGTALIIGSSDTYEVVVLFKGTNGVELPWHQDVHFWKLQPPITVTAWLAIDRAHGRDHRLQDHKG